MQKESYFISPEPLKLWLIWQGEPFFIDDFGKVLWKGLRVCVLPVMCVIASRKAFPSTFY